MDQVDDGTIADAEQRGTGVDAEQRGEAVEWHADLRPHPTIGWGR